MQGGGLYSSIKINNPMHQKVRHLFLAQSLPTSNFVTRCSATAAAAAAAAAATWTVTTGDDAGYADATDGRSSAEHGRKRTRNAGTR